MYDELISALREAHEYAMEWGENPFRYAALYKKAADAIEELEGKHFMMKKTAEWLAEKVPRWIPVTERLPKMHDEVLICNDDYGKTELGFATVAVWDGSDWVNSWDRKGTICSVTHWMPLPEPPEEET